MATAAPPARRRVRDPSAPEPSSWRAALLPFIATRAPLFGFAWWSLVRDPLRVPPWQVFPDARLLDGWLRWDSGWYLTIAREGYRALPGGAESTLGFFPLYPAATALLSLPFRPFLTTDHALGLGALLVSQASLFAALAGIHRIAAPRLGRAAADRALWLVCLFPFSFFLSAAYSESLFLALTVGAFVAADDERWWRAGALASLAALTRIPGLIVCVALGVEYLHRRQWNPRRIDASALPLALAPLSFAALMAHHAARFGDALAMFHVRTTGWHRPPGLRLLYDDTWNLLFAGDELRCAGAWPCLRDPGAAHLVIAGLNLLALPFGLWLSIRAARAFRGGLGVYALGSMAAALLNGVEGAGRVVAILFPVFLVLADDTHERRFFRVLGLVSAPLLLLLTFYFAHWFQVI